MIEIIMFTCLNFSMTPPPHITVGGLDFASSMISSFPLGDVTTGARSHMGLVPRFLGCNSIDISFSYQNLAENPAQVMF